MQPEAILLNRNTHDIPAKAIQFAERGELVEAIKATRELTGLNLADAKNVVDAYLRNPQGIPQLARSSARIGAEEVPRLAIKALENGRLIEAIKHTRDSNGLGLKDAKETVERFLEQNPATNSKFKAASSKDLKRVVITLVFALSLLGLLVVGYLYFVGNSQ